MLKIKKILYAFSIAELLVALAIVAVVGVTTVFTVKQQAEKKVAQSQHGTLICYKDADDNLHQSLEIVYPSGKKTKSEKHNITKCEYDFPKANNVPYKVTVIGGGGGGGSANKYATVNSDASNFNTVSKSIMLFACKMHKYIPSECGTSSTLNSPYDNNSLVSHYAHKHEGVWLEYSAYTRTNMDYSTIANDILDDSGKKVFSDDFFEKHLLSNLKIRISSGNGFAYNPATNYSTSTSRHKGINGTWSGNLKIGDKVFCASGADASYGCTGCGGRACLFTPNAAFIKIVGSQNVQALLQGGLFELTAGHTFIGYSTDYVRGASYPTCLGGACGSMTLENISNSTASNVSISYVAKTPKTITLYHGAGGSPGEQLSKETKSLSGRKLVIDSSQIGSGGVGGKCEHGVADKNCWGEMGSRTCYKAPGSNACSLNAYGGTGGLSNQGYDYTYTTHDKSISYWFNKKTPANEIKIMKGKKLYNVNNESAGDCEAVDASHTHICTFKNPEKDDYGASGGGGASAIYYNHVPIEYVVNSKTFKDNYIQNDTFGQGAHGAGGAIIVEW